MAAMITITPHRTATAMDRARMAMVTARMEAVTAARMVLVSAARMVLVSATLMGTAVIIKNG